MKTFPKFDTSAFLSGKAQGLDALDGLAAVILPFERRLDMFIEHEREKYEERAAIKCFDGEKPQARAEQEAFCEIIQLRSYKP